MAHGQSTWATYKWVALTLFVITIVEVWVYYIPTFVASRLFAPSLLMLSAVKFAIVALFYMHLKYDRRVFRAFLMAPLIIATATIMCLMFLFGKLTISGG